MKYKLKGLLKEYLLGWGIPKKLFKDYQKIT
jgi:hypothetical protein